MAARARSARNAAVAKPGPMPFTLRIGHLQITIHPWGDREADREDADGIYYPSKDAIYIRANRAPAEQVRILIHEVLHVIYDTWGIGDDALEEEAVCGRLDLGLVNVLQNNPHLLDILRGAFLATPRSIFN